jgi:HSP20 family protein
MEWKLKRVNKEFKNVKLKIKEDKTMLPMIRRSTYRPFLWSNLFDDDFFPVASGRNTSMPAVNIKEDNKRFTLELAVPGMDKKDLKIDVNEEVITISSEHREEKEEKNNDFRRKEFSYSSFCRSFYVPENVNKEKIEATYRDGILTVVLPKEEEEKAKISRQIKIS